VQENKNSHTSTISSQTRLPQTSKISFIQESYCLRLGRKAIAKGVSPNKATPLQVIGTNCLTVCLWFDENISLSWLEARAKK
jgi:hypothetical protein